MTKLKLTLLAAALLVAVPLAGCIGGSSTSNAPADTGVDAGDGPDANTNGSLPADKRPHVHDRWYDPSGSPTDVIDLVDREVTVEAVTTDDPNLINECQQPPVNSDPLVCAGQATFAPAETADGTKIVPPGTAKVQITLDFDASDFSNVRFYYQHRMSNGQWQKLGTFEAGQTITIAPVPVQISDDGHAHVSQWRFHVEPQGNPYTSDEYAWYGEGPIDIQITAHRVDGELPIEPPHPDFYESTPTYRIGQLSTDVQGYTQAARAHVEQGGCPTSVAGTCTPAAANSQGLIWSIRPGYEGKRLTSAEVPPEISGPHDRALVPPGSSVLGAAVHVDGQTTRGVEVCFRAMSSPDEGPYGRVIACEDYTGGPADFTVSTALTQKDVDSFYTDNTGHNASRWTFFVQVSALDAAGRDTVGGFSGSISAAVFVSQADTFQLPAWANVGQGGSA